MILIILKKESMLENIVIIILNQRKNLVQFAMVILIVMHVLEILHHIAILVNISVLYREKMEKFVMKKEQIK